MVNQNKRCSGGCDKGMSEENNKKNSEHNKQENSFLITVDEEAGSLEMQRDQLDAIKKEVFGDRKPTAEEEADFEKWLMESLSNTYKAIQEQTKNEETVEAKFLNENGEIVTGSVDAKDKEKMDEYWSRVMDMYEHRAERLATLGKIKIGLAIAWLLMILIQMESEYGTPLHYIALAMGITVAIAYADFTMKERYAQISLQQAEDLFQDCEGGFGLAVLSGEIISRKGEGLLVKIENTSRQVICYIDDVEWQSKIKFKQGTKVSVAEVIRHGRTPCYFIVGEAEN